MSYGVHPYRGNDLAGLPCIDCGLSKEGPVHRVAPSALEATENARDIALAYGLAITRERDTLRDAAQKVIDGYEARGLVHDVDCEELTDAVYALRTALGSREGSRNP